MRQLGITSRELRVFEVWSLGLGLEVSGFFGVLVGVFVVTSGFASKRF